MEAKPDQLSADRPGARTCPAGNGGDSPSRALAHKPAILFDDSFSALNLATDAARAALSFTVTTER